MRDGIRYTDEERVDYDKLVARGRSYYDDLRNVGIPHEDAFQLATDAYGFKAWLTVGEVL